MLGPYCYHCGQSEKGLIRHLAGVIGDFLDTVLNFDSRTFRTLWPLYFRPGFLTTEYFAGRRVRYVTPFRLYFFLCVITFLFIQVSLDFVDFDDKLQIGSQAESLYKANTPDEVERIEAQTIAQLEQAKSEQRTPEKAAAALEKAKATVHRKAEQRLAYLKSAAEAKSKGNPPPSDPDLDDEIHFGDPPWDPVSNPIHVEWLPDYANAKINALAVHMRDNVKRVRQNPKPLVIGLFTVLPQTLFVLMPLFAILLKLFYFFKRRLYMEHLMVALHSHSFIFLSLLLLSGFGLLRAWARTSAAWLVIPLDWAILAMSLWLPLYLLIMQKRVYRQGWFFTLLKFGLISFCYAFMVGVGITAALLISLATT